MSHSFFRTSVAVLFSLLFLGSVGAQDVEIVVTATKEPVAADTLPVGVTVLGAEDLAGKATVAEALDSTLAVRTSSLTPGQPALAAPGFGENGYGRISLLLDGVSQNNPDMSAVPLNLVPLFALERIEVLEGPASALYGDGAVAGAVNLITKVPQKFEAEVSASLESTLTNRQSAAFGIPVGEGGLLLSVQRDQDLPTRDRSDSDQYQAWTKFTHPSAWGGLDQDWSVWGAVSRTQTQLPGALTKAQYEANPDQAVNQKDEAARTETKGGLSWAAHGEAWSVTVPLASTYRAIRTTTVSWASYTDSALLLVSLEPRWDLSLGRWAGAEASWSGGLGLSGNRIDVDRYTDDSYTTRSMSALVERWNGSLWNRVEASWDGRWTASAVIRAEASRTQAHSDDNSAIDGTKDYWPVSGQAGLAWVPAQWTKVGVELSRVFRYPFLDEMIYYQGYSSDKFFSNIDPEVGHGVTLSASTRVGPADLKASGTLLRMENEIAYGTTQNENQGPTWHGTALTSAQWHPTEAASLGGEYTYELARYASGSHEGKTIPLVPSHRGRVWGELSWEKYLRAEAGWTLTSSFYTSGDYDNIDDPVPSAQSVDASVTANLGRPDLSLKIYGKNLTDDRTPSYVYSYIDATWGNSYGWYPSEGRVFGATVTWKL